MDIDLRAKPLLNFKIMQGDQFELPVVLQNPGGGSPMNLAGCVIASQMRMGTGVITATVTARSDAAGAFTLVFAGAATAAAAAGTWDWDVRITDALSKPKIYLRGTVQVTKRATHG